MDEPKRRGRPPKAAQFVHYGPAPEPVPIDAHIGPIPEATELNVIALRIWESQSPDLSNRERVARVKSRLVKMGFTDLGVLSLPCDEKHLNA